MRASMNVLCFLTVCLTYIALSEGMALKRAGELRCQCVKLESTEIPRRQILNFEIILKGPHCKNLEVIATVKTGKSTSQEICLDPTAPWVKRRIDRILDSSKTPSSTR
ncbi:alveolar macrophage chemotactic factor-like [Bufo gargarizans]|uniref:alveolar macrophage chemotactic factor-like n=1 Tax=Bufo gargarizans TaxID=30331 RepID=UPI001CF58210|nr:alveolar macrophage chemotactic factor-like [Bufo gargarizans]